MDGFINTDLSTDSSTKSSYLLILTPGALGAGAGAEALCNGGSACSLASTYHAGADPIFNGGIRFFGMNQGGTIYQATAALPVTQNGAPLGRQAFQSPPSARPPTCATGVERPSSRHDKWRRVGAASERLGCLRVVSLTLLPRAFTRLSDLYLGDERVNGGREG